MKAVAVLFLISALLLIQANAKPYPNDGLSLAANGCSSNCPGEAKVCGTDDHGRTQTFNNLCLLEASNCSNKTTFQKTNDGPCP